MTRQRKRLIQVALDREFGTDSAALIAVLKKIAFGQQFTVPGEIEGTVKKLTPTISEMREACLDLLAYQHGRPKQSVELEFDAPVQKWNPDALSWEELQEMDRLARKAEGKQLPAMSMPVIDASFTVLKDSKS